MLKHKLMDSRRDRCEAGAKQLARANEENWAVCRQRVIGLMAVTVILIICLSRPLYDLAWYSLHRELYSYIPLIPLISLYLIRSKR